MTAGGLDLGKETGMIELIDLGETRRDCSDLPGLQRLLKILVGQRFLSFRVSYGEELLQHLGDPRPYSNARMQNRMRGSFVVAARSSSWTVGSAPRHILATSEDARIHPIDVPGGESVDIKTIETGDFIAPSSIVTFAEYGRSAPGFWLQLRFSDDSMVHIQPGSEPVEDESESDAHSDDDAGLEISDWEILTPYQRILRAGPGLRWEYVDSTMTRSE